MSAETLGLLATLPPVIERYELKYVIPRKLVDRISEFISPYCDYDRHSLQHPDGFYPVNSLYFDSPNYRFLKLRQWGADQRFNMRVRAYGDGTEGPYFAEIKYKTSTSVKKFRCILPTTRLEDLPNLDAAKLDNGSVTEKERCSLELFLQLAESYAIEPKIFTCYSRRAFFSTMDDYARVTFDVDMRYRAQDPYTASNAYSMARGSDCINYDASNIYGDEFCYHENVVLELKATPGSIPLWMIELIRRFELKQIGFSKYMNSSMVGHIDNGLTYMANDRIAEGHAACH